MEDFYDINKIYYLMHKALKGNLFLDDLYSSWDVRWNQNKFLGEAFQNLEAALEHAPGYFLKKGINMKKWQKDINYKLLEIDLTLLDDLLLLDEVLLLQKRRLLIQNL